MLHNPVTTMPEPKEANMSFASIINSLGSKKDSSTFADSFCRVDEFETSDDFGAVHVTGDNVGFQAQKELSRIFAELNADSELESPILVSYFDEGPGARRGALVYTEEGKQPLVYCENALLGYSSSGVDVSQMILAHVGLFGSRSAETLASLQAKAKLQRRQSPDGAYSVTIIV